MAEQIKPETFTDALFPLLLETFEKVQGIFLDGGTSLFETIASLDSRQASTPVIDGGSTIAAHVFHINFYLEVHEKFVKGELSGRIDWASSWKLRTVNDSEWESLKDNLRKTYERIDRLYKAQSDWNSLHYLESALAVAAHTAYHLGAIRQQALIVTK